ncbi:uncharacterized protein LOC143237387 [Tachypleus tridentatus]|uniref:uncharacterized protein LOC143237387 n=1 Tax=Tachypleus tridentatus TaxID=6853 RepID=UPI003FD218FE
MGHQHQEREIRLDLKDSALPGQASHPAEKQDDVSYENINDVFKAILLQVKSTPEEIIFHKLLRHFLHINNALTSVKEAIWEAAEILVHTAILVETKEEAENLLTCVKHLRNYSSAKNNSCLSNCLNIQNDKQKTNQRSVMVQCSFKDLQISTPLSQTSSVLYSSEPSTKRQANVKEEHLQLPTTDESDFSTAVSTSPSSSGRHTDSQSSITSSFIPVSSLHLPPSPSSSSLVPPSPPPPSLPPSKCPPLPPSLPSLNGPPPPPPPPLLCLSLLSPPQPLGIKPPPPPGMISMHQVTLPQQAIPKPKNKMVSLNWNKIPTQKVTGQNNLWVLVASNHETTSNTLDFEMMESLFCQKQNSASRKNNENIITCNEDVTDAPNHKKKESQEIILLDSKRNLNVNVFLKQFRSSHEVIIQDILEGTNKYLGTEELKGLLKILPEDDEIKLLKAFKGKTQQLGNAEKFLKQLLGINNYKLRIESLLLKEEFDPIIVPLIDGLETIKLAAQEIKNSQCLREILYMVLIAGNFLNAGKYAGNAAGFKMMSLLKLTDIKATKPGMNLVHFVALQAEEKKPEVLKLPDELKNLENTTKISIEALKADIKNLNDRFNTLSNQLSNAHESIKDQMENFTNEAKRKVKQISEEAEKLEEVQTDLAEFLCEDVTTFKLDECFTVLRSFCQKFKDAIEENKLRKEQEMKAEIRRSQRKAQEARKKQSASTASRQRSPTLSGNETQTKLVGTLLNNGLPEFQNHDQSLSSTSDDSSIVSLSRSSSISSVSTSLDNSESTEFSSSFCDSSRRRQRRSGLLFDNGDDILSVLQDYSDQESTGYSSLSSNEDGSFDRHSFLRKSLQKRRKNLLLAEMNERDRIFSPPFFETSEEEEKEQNIQISAEVTVKEPLDVQKKSSVESNKEETGFESNKESLQSELSQEKLEQITNTTTNETYFTRTNRLYHSTKEYPATIATSVEDRLIKDDLDISNPCVKDKSRFRKSTLNMQYSCELTDKKDRRVSKQRIESECFTGKSWSSENSIITEASAPTEIEYKTLNCSFIKQLEVKSSEVENTLSSNPSETSSLIQSLDYCKTGIDPLPNLSNLASVEPLSKERPSKDAFDNSNLSKLSPVTSHENYKKEEHSEYQIPVSESNHKWVSENSVISKLSNRKFLRLSYLNKKIDDIIADTGKQGMYLTKDDYALSKVYTSNTVGNLRENRLYHSLKDYSTRNTSKEITECQMDNFHIVHRGPEVQVSSTEYTVAHNEGTCSEKKYRNQENENNETSDFDSVLDTESNKVYQINNADEKGTFNRFSRYRKTIRSTNNKSSIKDKVDCNFRNTTNHYSNNDSQITTQTGLKQRVGNRDTRSKISSQNKNPSLVRHASTREVIRYRDQPASKLQNNKVKEGANLSTKLVRSSSVRSHQISPLPSTIPKLSTTRKNTNMKENAILSAKVESDSKTNSKRVPKSYIYEPSQKLVQKTKLSSSSSQHETQKPKEKNVNTSTMNKENIFKKEKKSSDNFYKTESSNYVEKKQVAHIVSAESVKPSNLKKHDNTNEQQLKAIDTTCNKEVNLKTKSVPSQLKAVATRNYSDLALSRNRLHHYSMSNVKPRQISQNTTFRHSLKFQSSSKSPETKLQIQKQSNGSQIKFLANQNNTSTISKSPETPNLHSKKQTKKISRNSINMKTKCDTTLRPSETTIHKKSNSVL